MTKLCSVYATLLLLATSGTLMFMVAGDRCKENFGVCDHACNSRCASTYQDGQGVCTPSVEGDEQDYCWCSYDCDQKTCEVSLGLGGGCNDSECNSECAARYPQGGHGFCCSIGDPIYDNCHCQYYC